MSRYGDLIKESKHSAAMSAHEPNNPLAIYRPSESSQCLMTIAGLRRQNAFLKKCIKRMAVWIFTYDIREVIRKLCNEPLYYKYFSDKEYGEYLQAEVLERYQCLLIDIIRMSSISSTLGAADMADIMGKFSSISDEEIEKIYDMTDSESMLKILTSVVSDIGRTCAMGEKIEIYNGSEVVKVIQFNRGG